MRFIKMAAASAALVLSSLVITACGGDDAAATPEAAATAFVQKSFDGDVKGMVSLLAMGDEEKQYQEQIEGKLDMMAKKVQGNAKTHGGVDKLEAVETMSKDENNAVVHVKTTFKDGRDHIERLSVVKMDGAWKVKL